MEKSALTDPAYQRYRAAIAGESLPLAFVDLDAFDANLDRMLADAGAHHKRIRLATKSIRSVPLLRRVMERGGDAIAGLMAFTVPEAAFLVKNGFTDLFVAYPTCQAQDVAVLAELNQQTGVRVGAMVDCQEHVERLSRGGSPIPVLVEVDLSLRVPKTGLHLGARRSPVTDPDRVVDLVTEIHRHQNLEFLGLMAYEALVAGLTDRNPFTRLSNPAKAVIRKSSVRFAAQRRKTLAKVLAAAGFHTEIFNGGGTGSLSYTARESAITEVTIGSGLLVGHLFDYYSNLALAPAAFFAVQVVRRPGPGFVTCLGGGYVASGEAGRDKLPIPALPPGLELTEIEAAGEVQTPLLVPTEVESSLSLGDPIFFRHAKSGEIAERFAEFLLVRDDRVIERVPTYRGEGQVFL